MPVTVLCGPRALPSVSVLAVVAVVSFPSSILNSPFIQFLAETSEGQEAVLVRILSTRLHQETATDSTTQKCLGITV